MLISVTHSQTSVILRVKLRDSGVSTGAGKTGLTSSSSGLLISTIADNESSATVYAQGSSNIESITTLGTFAAPTSGKCRFKEVDSTNHKGIYEIQIADARYAVSSAKSLMVSISGVSGMAECDVVVPLGLPVNVSAFGGTAGTFSSGRPEVNASHFGGTAGTFSSGRPEVNASHLGGTSVNSVSMPGQGSPSATPNLLQAIMYLYKAWRNRKTQSSSQYSLYADDATTVDQKATVSADGTSADIGEVASGP